MYQRLNATCAPLRSTATTIGTQYGVLSSAAPPSTHAACFGSSGGSATPRAAAGRRSAKTSTSMIAPMKNGK